MLEKGGDIKKLYILTGPAGVDKSTISKNIANNLEKSTLIEGDNIYNQFVGGRISPWKENTPSDLFWEICLTLINNYLINNYDVISNYIIKKDKERPDNCRMGERSIILLKEFKEVNYKEKYILDTTNISTEESVKEILNNDRLLV